MTKKGKPELELGATVRLKAQSGEIIEDSVVHLWEEKSVQMVRVAPGDLVYNVLQKCWSMKRDRNDRDRRKALDLRASVGRHA
jgi:hypothetical protein